MNSEQAYIGCLLCYPRQTAEMLAAVDMHDLSAEGARVYAAVQALHEQGRQIDPVVVIETAGEDLRPYVTECVVQGEAEHVSAWQEHARIVTERAQLQRLQVLAVRVASCADLAGAQAAARELADAAQDRSTRDEWSMDELMRDTIADLHREPVCIETGFKKLDRRLMVSPGDFVVVGGRPSSGKTAFTLQMAAYMAKARRVAYFSLETGAAKTGQRLLATLGGVELEKLKRRTGLANDDVAWRKIAGASAQLRQSGLTYIHANGYDAARIAAKAQRLGAEVVFIDYLGLLQSRGQSRYEQVTNISVDLHNFAQRTGTAVFALSQLNRGSASGKPELHELRESGQIEQDADAVLLLDYIGARQNPPTNEHVVAVAKNKEGEIGDLRFRFFGETQRFYAEDRR